MSGMWRRECPADGGLCYEQGLCSLMCDDLSRNPGIEPIKPDVHKSGQDEWHRFTVTDIHTDDPKMFVDGKRVGQKAPGEFGQYSALNPQPIDVIEAWGLGYHEGTVLKYLSRWRRKGGLEDLKKSAWFLNRLIEQEEKRAVS